MKKIFISILFGFALLSCSSGGGGGSAANPGGGTVTEFGQNAAGTWLSGCTQDGSGVYREALVINDNGTGQYTQNYFQNTACTGTSNQSVGPVNFTYQVGAFANGVTQVTLNVAERAPVQVGISVQGNILDLITDQTTIRYTRVGQAPGNQNNFDLVAAGNWISTDCFQGESNTTLKLILNIKGRGQASLVENTFQSPNCSGAARLGRSQDSTYSVISFQNGQGQIKVNGQEINDVVIQGDRMTLTSPQQGTITYQRLK